MVTEKDLASTALSMSYEIQPTRNIVGDLSGLIGQFCEDFVAAFYPRSVSKKANVVITELFNNAVSYSDNAEESVRVELKLTGESLTVRVRNTASDEQCRLVQSRIRQMRRASSPRDLMARTIRSRRESRLPGGLGLMRLVAENKFALRSRKRGNMLTVEAAVELGGLV